MTRRARPLPRSDSGAASLLGVVWLAALFVLAGGGLVLLKVGHTRTQVAAAADLSALAAAQVVLEQPAQACVRGGEIAARNGARLTECRVVGVDVWVVAARDGPVGGSPLERLMEAATAQAHATVLATTGMAVTDGS